MLDAFSILTTSGVVLWSRNASPLSPTVINSFISDVFIEAKAGVAKANDISTAATNPPYRTEQRTLRWALVKELGLIFVAVYNSLLHLTYIEKLVDNVKLIFVSLYGEQLTKPHTSSVDCHNFDEYFDHQLNELEGTAGTVIKASRLAENAIDEKNLSSDDFVASGVADRGRTVSNTNGNSPPSTSPQAPAKLSRRARKIQNAGPAPVSSGDESGNNRRPKSSASSKAVKKGRKWDIDGTATDDAGDIKLDYSTRATGASSAHDSAPPSLEHIDRSTWGTTTKGKFVLKDLDDEVHGILADAANAKSRTQAESQKGLVGSGLRTISGLFRNVVGGKLLTAQDLEAPLRGMEEHLLNKNVAREAAVRLCESVERELLGLKTGSFESIHSRIQSTMESTLTKMLTPTTSLDLLREIDAVAHPSAFSLTSSSAPRPYVLSIVGVNGVGKSTNLAKICYFLLQNRYRVLVAASDTFRSGAVEQLRTHVRNLSELASREANGSRVELYERGYGKDAAAIAREAVTHAARGGQFDVVLIDTAGRRHNDQRLMSDLEKFATLARPDKILMVGEALVGTDSVAQARNFNGAFGPGRGLDGFLISKCDTVGDMVGSIVSLVHATNVPVVFVGVGQHYSDLRNFSTKWAVEKLLSSSN